MAGKPSTPNKAELSSSIRELTDTIEARQEKKSEQRIKRQHDRKVKEKNQVLERLIAPIILLLTIVFSLLALAFKN